jgi:hypothetical protein
MERNNKCFRKKITEASKSWEKWKAKKGEF